MSKQIKVRIPKKATKKQIRELVAARLDKHIKTDMLSTLGAVAITFQEEFDKPHKPPTAAKPLKTPPPNV